MTKDSGIDKGKESITPPASKKFFLDRASNRLARTIAQIRTGHWLCAPYIKRVRKNREEQVSNKCWWCSQYRMSRAHVFLRCKKPLADWMMATGVGLVGQEMRDKEAERVERNDGWRREPFL